MKRKKWEPEYHFGGNPADYVKPNPLGENQSPYLIKRKLKKGKRK